MATSGGIVTGFAPSPLVASLQLPQWRLALTDVRNGTSNAKLLCLGDSTTAGYGSSVDTTLPTTHSYPARLATLFNSYHVSSSQGLAVPISNITAVADNRWSYGSGWTAANFGMAATDAVTCQTPPSLGPLVFTAGILADTYDVYYLVGGGLGSITITATGGTPVVVNCNGTNATGKTTVTAATASTANTVSITAATAFVCVTMIEPSLSTKTQVLVGNSGVAGATSTNYAYDGGGNPQFVTAGGIAAYQPNASIISLGINDAGNSVPVSTYIANITAVANECAVTGDVILKSMPPSANAPYSTFEALYVPALKALTASKNWLFIDWYARFGSSYTTAFAQGFMQGVLHPNDYGYWDIADYDAQLLTNF